MRTTLTGRVSPRFQVGVEFNASAPQEKLNPVGNYFVQTETASKPGVTAGFSSDRIGTPYGMSYFVSAQKQLGGQTGRLECGAGDCAGETGCAMDCVVGSVCAVRATEPSAFGGGELPAVP